MKAEIKEWVRRCGFRTWDECSREGIEGPVLASRDENSRENGEPVEGAVFEGGSGGDRVGEGIVEGESGNGKVEVGKSKRRRRSRKGGETSINNNNSACPNFLYP